MMNKIHWVLQLTPIHGPSIVGEPAETFFHLLCVDTGCHLEDLPKAIAIWNR